MSANGRKAQALARSAVGSDLFGTYFVGFPAFIVLSGCGRPALLVRSEAVSTFRILLS
jgi:hypothetical protein